MFVGKNAGSIGIGAAIGETDPADDADEVGEEGKLKKIKIRSDPGDEHSGGNRCTPLDRNCCGGVSVDQLEVQMSSSEVEESSEVGEDDPVKSAPKTLLTPCSGGHWQSGFRLTSYSVRVVAPT